MNLQGIGSSGKKGVVKPYLCKTCNETNPDNFYGGQKIQCKSCHIKSTHQTQKDVRMQAIKHKGGCCEKCGYNNYTGALQFHHKDPTKKDPKAFRRTKNLQVFLEEVDKCALLCANCHAEEHAILGGWDGLRRDG